MGVILVVLRNIHGWKSDISDFVKSEVGRIGRYGDTLGRRLGRLSQ